MTKLCTYVVREDTGLAPNPFWGYCTLAVCTPNHQGIQLTEGDWLVGFLTKARGHRLLYAMQVEMVLGFNAYYRDPRFSQKKPDLRGTWQERCGDNFYSLAADGSWVQHRNRFHLSEGLKLQDTKHARVFISQRFSYLGSAARRAPDKFAPLIGGRGVRVNHDPGLQGAFIEWIQTELPLGIQGLPNDNPDLEP